VLLLPEKGREVLMKIAIMKERRAGEMRVAATPGTVTKMIALGYNIVVETGAGEARQIADEEYEAAGAMLEADARQLLRDADIVLKVRRPLLANEVKAGEGDLDELALFKRGSLLLAWLEPYANTAAIYAYAAADVTAVDLEQVPRSAQLITDPNHAYAEMIADYIATHAHPMHMQLEQADGMACPYVLTHAGHILRAAAGAKTRRLV
jgi:H+-translocating NAD(P) transhydrogenase subunit alpha